MTLNNRRNSSCVRKWMVRASCRLTCVAGDGCTTAA